MKPFHTKLFFIYVYDKKCEDITGGWEIEKDIKEDIKEVGYKGGGITMLGRYQYI